ncbi:MAG: hypothetical protein JSV04_10915 [Candidatus Heimdallarchaeota archaeon]|nr:MAG: hypothetical protein JSV04_10915 [Candidatus Heimdallarchaeota archaeon]
MKSRGHLILVSAMLVFIFLHAFYSEIGFFERTNERIMPFLGGFSPAITHDSTSTRNPAIEPFWAVLSDLPGAYSFYFSPIFITAPKIVNGEVNRQAVPKWTGLRNPADTRLNALQSQQLIFLSFIGILAILLALLWALRSYYREKRHHRRQL